MTLHFLGYDLRTVLDNRSKTWTSSGTFWLARHTPVTFLFKMYFNLRRGCFCPRSYWYQTAQVSMFNQKADLWFVRSIILMSENIPKTNEIAQAPTISASTSEIFRILASLNKRQDQTRSEVLIPMFYRYARRSGECSKSLWWCLARVKGPMAPLKIGRRDPWIQAYEEWPKGWGSYRGCPDDVYGGTGVSGLYSQMDLDGTQMEVLWSVQWILLWQL